MATLAAPSLEAFIDAVGGRAACLSLSRDPNAKLTILLFPPGAARPAYAAKVPVTDAAARSVQRESARLAEISGRDLGPMRATVPTVIGHFEHLGRPTLVTTALPGQSMLAAYHAWHHTARRTSVAADFAAAGAWLTCLHQATAGGIGRLGATLEGAAEAIRGRFGGRDGADADLASIDALRRRLDGQPVPVSLVHGDFWPGNLLVTNGQVSGVIDWEMARPDAPATCDIARFALAYSLYLDRHTRPGRLVSGHRGLRAGRWGAGVEYAVNGSGWYPALIRDFVVRGLERLGVPASCWRDVLLADIAVTAAQADHAEFAWNHLLLFRRLGDRT